MTSLSTRFYKKTISSHCLDLQKANGLLSTLCAFRPKGFLDKTGRGWSRDAVIQTRTQSLFKYFWGREKIGD